MYKLRNTTSVDILILIYFSYFQIEIVKPQIYRNNLRLCTFSSVNVY